MPAMSLNLREVQLFLSGNDVWHPQSRILDVGLTMMTAKSNLELQLLDWIGSPTLNRVLVALW
jgi:hypothetical protein